MKQICLLLAIFGLFGLVCSFDGEQRDKTGCPKAFLQRCECKKQRTHLWKPKRNDTFVVNCTNSRFTNTAMLEMLPDETEVLIFNGNDISYLPNNVLGIVQEHELLKVIDLSNNNISEISGKAFHKVRNVEILILNHNDLRISGEESHPRLLTNFNNLKELYLTNAFTEVIDSTYYLKDLEAILMAASAEGVNSLWKLNLEQNEIWEISDKLFCSDIVPSLTHLYLGNNQLSNLNFEFECIKKLQYLDVEYNKIKRLGRSSLQRIDRFFTQPKKSEDLIRKINLVGNPFVCDCNLRPMFDWLRDTTANLYRRDNLRCYTGIPEINAGRQILNIGELKCLDSDLDPLVHPHPHSSSGNGITHTLLIILIILILCLLGALLFIHKEKVQTNVKPLIDNFQRSLQYRTIEKDLSESQIPPEVNV